MTDEIVSLREKFYNATVSNVIEIHESLRIFQIKPDGDLPDYTQGQYTTLGLGLWEKRVGSNPPEILKEGMEKKLLRRAYSMSHSVIDLKSGKLLSPEETPFFEFYINRVIIDSKAPPTSPMLTCRLFGLKKGDRLAFGPKVTGHYILENFKPTDTMLFCATGTGEAPHNAMLWKLLRDGHKGKIISMVTTRKSEDQGYRKQHEKLMEIFPNYKAIFIATRDPGVTEKIYAQDMIEKALLTRQTGANIDPADTHVFLCGNPALIGRPLEENGVKTYPTPKGMIEVLENRGFTVHSKTAPGNIHFEAYW